MDGIRIAGGPPAAPATFTSAPCAEGSRVPSGIISGWDQVAARFHFHGSKSKFHGIVFLLPWK